jgi:hypothetical protein
MELNTNMKYTNCPTCGGSAKFISDNFERANILISAEQDSSKKIIDSLLDEIEFLESLVDNGLKIISSDDLFYLYQRKKKQEIKDNQIRLDGEYFLIDKEAERLKKLAEEGFRKMLGNL